MALRLALDWTPNTNHLGFFVAAAREWYDRPVELFSPAEDDYARSPAKRVATGEADLGIAPSESVVSYATHPEYDDLVAVAAVAQRDTSAVAVHADGPVQRPRDLDGCTYASYGARFETDIVAELIRADGGRGEFAVVEPELLSVPDVLGHEADATWVFEPWEGLLAERAGTPLRGFSLHEYGVPYGYTPLVLAHPDTLAERPTAVRAVLDAAARGYRAAAEDPERAAADLAAVGEGPHLDDREFLAESARRLVDAFCTDDGRWGRMERARWAAFVDWLHDRAVLRSVEGAPLDPDALDVDALFTNDYLPA
jgi:NitT/TauT family transport system substrate-binding protein